VAGVLEIHKKWNPVIAIVLAGGYGKRLWPLTRDKAKPLLPVAGKPVIDYLVEKLLPLKDSVNRVVVLTNSRFKEQFEKWAKGWASLNVDVVSDGSSCEGEKPGAVGALAEMADLIHEDFLVIAGDCIYDDDLKGFVEFFNSRKLPIVAVYHAKDVGQILRGSTVSLDPENRIINFVEKPETPLTELVGAVIYAFPERIKNRIKEYLRLGLCNDEPGRFMEWLHKKEAVYGFMLKNVVWDIGTLEAYREIDMLFSSKTVFGNAKSKCSSVEVNG
jgi:glucose-1-phosphate thymidylyltransferase